MRFAILGLSLSHPFVFADYLRSRGHAIAAVWDYDAARAEPFAQKHGAELKASPAEAVAAGVDAVIVTSMTCDHPAHARLALEAGLPVCIDKLMCLNPADAEALVGMGPLVMAGSALRFLPDFCELAGRVRSGAIGLPLTATGTVLHGMKQYLSEPHAWQDDPARCGGVLMNMGVHAVDLLVAALGPDWAVAAAERSRRVYPQALSEDQAAFLLRGARGELATVQVVSGSEQHRYAFSVTGTLGEAAWQFPDPARQAGNIYAPMLDALVEAVATGVWPIPPAELLAVVRILAAARALAPVR